MDIRFYKDVGDYLHFEKNKPFQMHIENEKKEKKLAVRELMKQMRRLNSNASCESIGDISFLPVSGNVKLSQILTSDSVLQSDNVALIFDVYDGTQTCRVLWMKEKEKGQKEKGGQRCTGSQPRRGCINGSNLCHPGVGWATNHTTGCMCSAEARAQKGP